MSYKELLNHVNEGRGGIVDISAEEAPWAWRLMKVRGFFEVDMTSFKSNLSLAELSAFMEKHFIQIRPIDEIEPRIYLLGRFEGEGQ